MEGEDLSDQDGVGTAAIGGLKQGKQKRELTEKEFFGSKIHV